MPQVNVAEMLYECKVIHLNVAEMPLDVGLLPNFNGKVQASALASVLSNIDFFKVLLFGVPRHQHFFNCFFVAIYTLEDKCLMPPFCQPDLSISDDATNDN